MAIIGFNYKRMNVEKKKPAKGNINVSYNIVIDDVKKAKVNIGNSKKGGAEFTFKFKVNYEPEMADLVLEGSLVYIGEEDKVKEVLKKWDDKKKITKDVFEEVYNYIFRKSNVQALMLTKEMGLPPHFKMPKVSIKEETKKKEPKKIKIS